MGKQFSDVSSRYGAPMGRRSVGDPGDKPMNLFRVNMVDGDYDDGGAYWGMGDPIYCLRGEGPDEMVERFVRAKSRWQAFEEFKTEFPNLKLKVPV